MQLFIPRSISFKSLIFIQKHVNILIKGEYMDFVHFLDLLKKQQEIPDWEQAKKDITNEVNDIILSTQNISDRFKRKKVQRLLTPLVDSIEAIINEIDTAKENSTQVKMPRIQRSVDTILEVKNKMEKLAQ